MSTAVAVLDTEARAVAAVWRHETAALLRGRRRLALDVAQPLLVLTALAAGAGTVAPGSGTGYAAFLFPGVLAMAVQSPALATATSILRDREHGLLRQLLMAPVRRESLLLGKVLARTAIATCHGAVLLVFAGAAHLPYDPALFASLIAVLALAAFAMASLGALLAVCLSGPRSLRTLTGLFLGPLVLLSGALFPVSGLPPWLAAFAALNPLTYAVDAARRTLTGHLPDTAPDALFESLRVWGLRPSVVEELGVLACFGALCLFLAARRFSRPGQDPRPSGPGSLPPST